VNAPVVTLFEAYGAGADVVGPALAEQLGVPWIGQATTSEQYEAADAKGTGRINVRQFLTSLAFLDQGSVELVQDPMEELARDQAQQVRGLVASGGVILGRNATVILTGLPGALHVKLDGPREYRVARAAQAAGITEEQAALRQQREDAARAEISLEVWGWDPRLTAWYDLVINTATFGLAAAGEMIVDALNRKRVAAGLQPVAG
jgi:hypothetical protein